MNIFHKVALQGLKQNRTRTFVTIIGVILSSVLITAIGTFGISLQNYMINGAVEKYGDWHIGFTDVPDSFIQEQSEDTRVEKIVSYENIGYAMLDGGINEYKPYLFIAGFNKDTFETLPVNLLSGRLPENSSEVIVPAHVASNGGVKFSVGDVLTLAVGKRQSGEEILNQHDSYRTGNDGTENLVLGDEKVYTVVGTYQRPSFEEHSAPGYMLITFSDVASPESSTAVITLKNPYKLHSYRKKAQGGDAVLNDEVLRFMGLSGDKIFNTLLYSAGGILIILIMIGSIFMIYNAFNISLNERTHQFGIFMSVGATERQLRNTVLFEGMCIGVIGIPIGILIALESVKYVLSIVETKFGNVLYEGVRLKLTISLPVLVAAAIISLITILISAYIPARKAARIPVMECIRQTNEIKAEAKAVKTSKLAQKIYGLEGTLALKNFKRNKRRFRSIILSLTFSVVLFVATSAFGLYLQQEADQVVVDVDYDISFTAKQMEEEEFLMLFDNLKKVSGVYDSSCQTTGSDGTVIQEMTFCSNNPGQSATQMKEILEGAGITSGYTLVNCHEVLEQNRNLLFIVHLFTTVFSGMMALIAVANVFNTISTNIKLRKRELAMIRSMGMTDRDFDKMMRFECSFYGIKTLLYMLPLSGVFSYLMYLGINGMENGGEDGVAFTLPWSSIGISILAVFFVIFITTVYTVGKIKKENIIDAVRDDME